MKILSWNLNNKENSKYICDLINTENADIAVFCEHKGLNKEKIEETLKNYEFIAGLGGCEKIIYLIKKDISYEIRREASRYSILSFFINGIEYILVGIHLPSNPNSNSDDRKDVIRELIPDIREIEKDLNCSNTIVTGDFNASPFDTELTQKSMFNAVLFKDVILNKDEITYQNKKYKRFYNPMLNFISENGKQYGSLYYTNGSSSLIWYTYDQVLVRRPLVDKIVDVHFCLKADRTSLVTKIGIPRKDAISDHLPLMFEVEE